jgi:hypothetical protein
MRKSASRSGVDDQENLVSGIMGTDGVLDVDRVGGIGGEDGFGLDAFVLHDPGEDANVASKKRAREEVEKIAPGPTKKPNADSGDYAIDLSGEPASGDSATRAAEERGRGGGGGAETRKAGSKPVDQGKKRVADDEEDDEEKEVESSSSSSSVDLEQQLVCLVREEVNPLGKTFTVPQLKGRFFLGVACFLNGPGVAVKEEDVARRQQKAAH